MAAILDLKSWAIAPDGEVIETRIGHRYACQRCSAVYSVGPSGVFRHHVRSLPLTPEVDQPMLAEGDEQNGKILPPLHQRPIPRRAPGV